MAKKPKHSKSLYYVQPDGSMKKGADGRSVGVTKAEIKKKGTKK